MRHDYEGDIERQIGRGATTKSSPQGFTIELECSEGHTITKSLGKQKMPPEAINRRLCNEGWKTGKKLTCPEHAKKEKTMADPVEPTPAAKRVHRLVMEALMVVYDEEKKGYQKDYTDARVAEETGAAVGYVRKTREDYFGPLTEPLVVGVFRRDLERMAEDIKTLARNIDQKQRAEKSALDEAEKGLIELRARLVKISKEWGW